MIDQLIQSLKSSENFGNKFKSNDTHYVFLTSGGYRTYDKGRIVVIVFDGSQPRLVVKFYKNSDSISDEYKIQTQIYKIYGNMIAKPLGIERINDYDILVEEPILGKNLTRYIPQNLNKHALLEVFKLIFAFNKNLNSKLEISNIQNLTEEIDQLFKTFYSNFKISNSHEDMIKNLRSVFLKNFENKKIFQRFSNNDFILNNLIIHKKNLTLTDFEFSTKTHLYFLEWYKFFRYQWIVSNDYIHDLTMSEIDDPFYELGLKEFSNYKINEKFELACRLIFEIFDFTKRFSISSLSTQKTLSDDMEKFLIKLNSRYDDPNIVQKESNLNSSEKEFFNDEYQKLTQYKKSTDELLLLRKSNDELHSEVVNLRKHSDELRDEIKRLELDHKNYKKSIQETHENYKKSIQEIHENHTKSIQETHENYRRDVESSLLWKFTKTFDKLLGKKIRDFDT